MPRRSRGFFRACVAAVLLLLTAIAPIEAFACSATDTYASAMSQCNASVAAHPQLQCVTGTVPSDPTTGFVRLQDAQQNTFGVWNFCGGVPPSCTAGQAVPPGTQVSYYQSTGESCSGSCEMALDAGTFSGGVWSGGGGYVLNGSACSSTGTAKQPSLTKPSETTNADGSRTLCDPISGKCVTTNTHISTVPASSSSSGNHSTDSSSITNNPASSSSTTTTTTTTGDGSGSGTGTGSGSSTSVSHSTTDTPASASSTASKCDTGVCDVGNADGDTGGLYTASSDTPQSVYSNFVGQVSNSPIVSAATGFFTVSLSGTSCPTWTLPGNQYWGPSGLTFSSFCDPNFLAMLTMAGYIVLGVAAFCAFRIAIY